MCGCYMVEPSVYRERRRKARVPHRCSSCGHVIQRGELYVYSSGIWDGRPNDYKRHELCAVLEDRTRAMDGCGVGLGELHEARELRHGASRAFRTAWEAVMQTSWGGCEDCGGHLPYRHSGPRCPDCMAEHVGRDTVPVTPA